MHNQRNRRAAEPKPAKVMTLASAPAFPAEITIPPHRGAIGMAVEQPEPSVAALFAMPQQAKPKAPARKRKPAALRRKAQRRAKATGKPPRRGPKIEASAIALSAAAEPLVTPLPRGQALAPYRPGGVLSAVADWLRHKGLGLWDRLGGVPTARPAPRRARLSPEAEELRRLRAENARLKRQLLAFARKEPPSPVKV
jgi:hypothetical protein